MGWANALPAKIRTMAHTIDRRSGLARIANRAFLRMPRRIQSRQFALRRVGIEQVEARIDSESRVEFLARLLRLAQPPRDHARVKQKQRVAGTVLDRFFACLGGL